MSADELQRLIGPVLKGLYPQNPDVVLGREARLIADALLDGPLRLARIGAWVEQHEWPHGAPSGEYRLCALAAGAPVEAPARRRTVSAKPVLGPEFTVHVSRMGKAKVEVDPPLNLDMDCLYFVFRTRSATIRASGCTVEPPRGLLGEAIRVYGGPYVVGLVSVFVEAVDGSEHGFTVLNDGASVEIGKRL